ncbi:hypothetical protein [Nonomuraea sp. CA-141351]|uniref:hypothetical protein n=1 Tax=Nonomuraea sp. CA-141351 TaxID=3239996 RepID=UPI003D8C6F13
MPATSAAVLASGAKSAAKLLVAALAFTGAYAGFAAPDGAGAPPEHVMTVTLSAREVPYTEQLEPRMTVNRSRAPKPSRTSVSR